MMARRKSPVLVLHGSEEYRDFLNRLRAAEGAQSLSDLAETLIAERARQHGLKPPQRVRPMGWNQHAEP